VAVGVFAVGFEVFFWVVIRINIDIFGLQPEFLVGSNSELSLPG
jgi:hypothetical protein